MRCLRLRAHWCDRHPGASGSFDPVEGHPRHSGARPSGVRHPASGRGSRSTYRRDRPITDVQPSMRQLLGCGWPVPHYPDRAAADVTIRPLAE
jgi:hypothetical protein